jgi:hypothetical protein
MRRSAIYRARGGAVGPQLRKCDMTPTLRRDLSRFYATQYPHEIFKLHYRPPRQWIVTIIIPGLFSSSSP